jgi:two-component system cell cycle sensor histidine kinase/response regulator CckA
MYLSSEQTALQYNKTIADKKLEPTNKKLVLLVDDEAIMQDLGKQLLEAHGYSVMIAADGIEAVDIYRKYGKDIDLVILDILMPGLDGGQTYLQLKNIDTNVKAFFCTGYTPRDVIGSLLEEESLHALQKPFRPVEFVRLVQEVIAG